jgi:multicomponent Na+:H+ antiporter subunit G
MTGWIDLFTLVCVGLGSLFFVAGTVGLLRFPDTLSRLHALTKADNLGLGLVILGLLPQVAWPFGALKLVALWVVALLAGGTAGQVLGGAIGEESGGAWSESGSGSDPGLGRSAGSKTTAGGPRP